jgi:putative ABC transport system permease protein
MVSAVSPEAIPEAQRQITTLLRERHRIRRGQNDDFTIRNLADIAATAESTNQVMSILLASVASVSLLVGGIGIMNIMLVSVTERTREIGIRKAMGAKKRDIMLQFVSEATLLSLGGGAMGVLLGALLAWSLNGRTLLGNSPSQTAFSGDIALLALAVSACIGLFFGIYPALRAASLHPIDALRYE